MRDNLEVGGGLAYSQNVLLALVDDGLPREDAYAIVQSAAAAAWDEGRAFRAEIEVEPRVASRLSPERLAGLFDPGRALRNLDVVFDRLEKIGVEDR
jgi:adenylosuccinate lyase